MVYFRSRISLLIFCLDNLSIDNNGVSKSTMTTVLELIYAFRSFRVRLMILGILILGAYRLIIAVSFWSISLFITMECPSLCRLINVGLKSTLSEISIASPACFGGSLAW
jgi:hypothetical protein